VFLLKEEVLDKLKRKTKSNKEDHPKLKIKYLNLILRLLSSKKDRAKLLKKVKKHCSNKKTRGL
jgi:NRPS condensation-like uncharacterized protein